MSMKIEIACPKCNWQPDGGIHWTCSCGFDFDTFSSSGKYPSCLKVWDLTQCPKHGGGCNKWSKHIDWYRNLSAEIRKQIEEILQNEWVKVK